MACRQSRASISVARPGRGMIDHDPVTNVTNVDDVADRTEYLTRIIEKGL
jgi:hypothetical protein